MKRSEAAFTLIEVLGALAILAILYTTLARVAMEGLRAETENKNRMEASLLADTELANIELGIAAGVVPAEGETETEVEDFRVTVAVTPFEIPALSDPTGSEDAQAKEASVLSSGANGETNPLRAIEVRVVWDEAGFERHVVRTTYAFDAAASR